MLRAKGIWYNRVLRQKLGCFSTERDHHVARFYAAEVMKRLQKGRYDVVVSPGSIPVAYVDSSVPIVIWTITDLTEADRTRLFHSAQRMGKLPT